MGLVTEEEGVLKLVHRGRSVEIHKKPILAKEVMRQNPKHLITRADFFKYPWVVVRPDSMLHLGRAFLIVPAHTVYQLMKANGHTKQSSPPCLTNPSCSGIFGLRPTEDRNLPRMPDAGARMTPKHHRSRRERPSRQVHDEHRRKKGPEQLVHETESEYESAPESVTKYQTSYLEFKRIWMSDGYESASAGEDSSGVKPCLRKQDSERKPQPLRVAFMLPAKCEERNRRTFPVYRA